MIIVRLKGGLGNQMFQYATGLMVSFLHKDILKIDASGYDDPLYVQGNTPRTYRMHAFCISNELAVIKEIESHKYPFGILSKLVRFITNRVLKRNKNLDYSVDYFKKKHSYIDGYFQSEKNFLKVADIVRKEFTLKKEFESENFSLEKNKIDLSKSVSVHIRRGDYANDKITNNYWGTCSLEYYKKAMEIINSKINSPIFYFFSDDIEWVKKEFGENSNYVFISNPKLQDYEELILMSLCSHNIIANSSFSWWGAWLNDNPNKVVIAPKKWVNVNPSPHPNIIPEGWITV